MVTSKEVLEIQKKINILTQEHQELDETLSDAEKLSSLSEFTICKLKRRKLALKDEISLWQLRINGNDIA